MHDGPHIARMAAVIGDPARANMLVALIDGGALTASELAAEAGVTRQTASTHIARLSDAGFLARTVQGRNHYFRLSGPEIATAIESLMGVAEGHGGRRTRPGPNDVALRHARICYDHLAGELGVDLHDRLIARGWIAAAPGDGIALSDSGRAALDDLGVDVDELASKRRPLCRPCLDWSMRRHHLAGSIGAALLARIIALGWAARVPASRVIRFSADGERAFREAF